MAVRTLITVYSDTSFDVRYSVWGIVYLFPGHAKCLLSDERTAPHFLFGHPASGPCGANFNVMYCRNCGHEMSDAAAVCTHCGVLRNDGDAFCPTCGAQPDPKAVVCVKCGTQLKSFAENGRKPDRKDSQRNEKLVNGNVHSMGEAISSCFRKYAVFKGRACRAEFLWWYLFYCLCMSAGIFLLLGGVLIAEEEGAIAGAVLIGILAIVYLLPMAAVSVRRLHDTGRSGWWYFITFVPYVGGLVLFILLLLAPDPQTNRYGTNPLDA